MFRIGDFSRIARVSCRLLRYYDELGLLKPASVEQHTGYRYYSAAQLPRLNRILVLKELGLSLEEIARIVDANASAAELRGMLLMRRTELERALATESERLRQIETRIAQIDAEGRLSADDVVMRAEPAHAIVSVRQVLPSFTAARDSIRRISGALRARTPAPALGSLIAIAHAAEFELDRLDVEIGFMLRNGPIADVVIPDLGTLRSRQLEAVDKIAACVRVGLPEHAHLITAKIGQFVEANGYRLAGPGREVFLQPPDPARMEESVVEMQFPVEKASGRA